METYVSNEPSENRAIIDWFLSLAGTKPTKPVIIYYRGRTRTTYIDPTPPTKRKVIKV